MSILKIYWLMFPDSSIDELPLGVKAGCGVTALSASDAERMVRTTAFAGRRFPEIFNSRRIKSMEELDQKHVIPNSGNSLKRGIWYPLGYDEP